MIHRRTGFLGHPGIIVQAVFGACLCCAQLIEPNLFGGAYASHSCSQIGSYVRSMTTSLPAHLSSAPWYVNGILARRCKDNHLTSLSSGEHLLSVRNERPRTIVWCGPNAHGAYPYRDQRRIPRSEVGRMFHSALFALARCL